MYAIVLLHVLVLLLSIWIFFIGLKRGTPVTVVLVMLFGILLLGLDGYSFMMFLETLRE